jgi:hypothetical protein
MLRLRVGGEEITRRISGRGELDTTVEDPLDVAADELWDPDRRF